MTSVNPNLFVVRITSVRDSESRERAALYLSGWMRDKTVEELRGFLSHLPIIITRQASSELADRLQRELSALGVGVELSPVETGAAPAAAGPPSLPPPIPTSAPRTWSDSHFPAQLAAGPGIPWDSRRQAGFFKAWWDTLFQSLRWPNEFYARMPVRGGYFEPVLYAVITTMIGVLVSLLWQVPLQLIPLAASHGLMGKLGAGFGMAAIAFFAFLALLFLPIFLALGEFIGAAIGHIFVKIMGGQGSYEVTFRVLCFANSSQVFQVVPGLGGIIAMVFWGIQVYFGYRHAHRMNQTQALVAMFLPVALALALVVAAVVAIMVWLVGSSGGLQKLLHD